MKPALFTELSFADAAAAASREQRLLLVDFTAEWCAPCKNMDRTTWLDPAVVAWVAQHAIAIQVDVDADQATAARFEVRAMPTLMLMRDEAVLDRSMGGRPASKLLEWLDAVLAGRREVDTLREKASGSDPSARLHLAQRLIEDGQYDEALTSLTELWEHGHHWEPGWVGVRQSYLLGEVTSLMDRWPQARTTFAMLRDNLTPQLPEKEATFDWLALNETLGEPERSLEWFDGVKANPPDWLEHEYRIVGLLVSAERWSDLGALIRSPLEHLARECELTGYMAEAAEESPELEHLLEFGKQQVRTKATVLIRALRAAGRDAEAATVQADARLHDASDEMRDATT